MGYEQKDSVASLDELYNLTTTNFSETTSETYSTEFHQLIKTFGSGVDNDWQTDCM